MENEEKLKGIGKKEIKQYLLMNEGRKERLVKVNIFKMHICIQRHYGK